MSLTDTITEIANICNNLGSGQPDERLKSAYYLQLARAFSQLAQDLKAKPGWSAATGTADRTAFDTATATTTVLAQHLKALTDDLISRGDIGP